MPSDKMAQIIVLLTVDVGTRDSVNVVVVSRRSESVHGQRQRRNPDSLLCGHRPRKMCPKTCGRVEVTLVLG